MPRRDDRLFFIYIARTCFSNKFNKFYSSNSSLTFTHTASSHKTPTAKKWTPQRSAPAPAKSLPETSHGAPSSDKLGSPEVRLRSTGQRSTAMPPRHRHCWRPEPRWMPGTTVVGDAQGSGVKGEEGLREVWCGERF